MQPHPAVVLAGAAGEGRLAGGTAGRGLVSGPLGAVDLVVALAVAPGSNTPGDSVAHILHWTHMTPRVVLPYRARAGPITAVQAAALCLHTSVASP